MIIIILFGIKQLKKLWKKTFENIHQLSCFVGHPVSSVESNQIMCATNEAWQVSLSLKFGKKGKIC